MSALTGGCGGRRRGTRSTGNGGEIRGMGSGDFSGREMRPGGRGVEMVTGSSGRRATG